MDNLLTVQEVARRLRLHHMTVRRQIRSGRLRALRIGRGIRVREQDLESFMKPEGSHEITPEELREKLFAPPTPEELERRRKAFAEAARLRAKSKPLGFSTATLVRAARRETEVLYGDKTWEELIAEES